MAARAARIVISPERYPLFLYKSILRLHYGLPPPARLMGDAYVKDEFKKHKNAKPEFVKPFIDEWTNYCVMLSKQLSAQGIKRGTVGMELSDEKLDQLAEEQIRQLVELRIEAEKHLGKYDFARRIEEVEHSNK